MIRKGLPPLGEVAAKRTKGVAPPLDTIAAQTGLRRGCSRRRRYPLSPLRGQLPQRGSIFKGYPCGPNLLKPFSPGQSARLNPNHSTMPRQIPPKIPSGQGRIQG